MLSRNDSRNDHINWLDWSVQVYYTWPQVFRGSHKPIIALFLDMRVFLVDTRNFWAVHVDFHVQTTCKCVEACLGVVIGLVDKRNFWTVHVDLHVQTKHLKGCLGMVIDLGARCWMITMSDGCAYIMLCCQSPCGSWNNVSLQQRPVRGWFAWQRSDDFPCLPGSFMVCLTI